MLFPLSIMAFDSAGYHYLNKIREKAGLMALSINPLLEKSASNHLNYLNLNKIISHHESSSQTGYTGTTVSDRVFHVQYPSSSVSENISHENKNGHDSINGLMSAIYHRIAFLDLLIDEIGAESHQNNNERYSFVYNMGKSWVGKLCNRKEEKTTGKYYTKICKNHRKIKATLFDGEKLERLKKNPPYVIWPPENSQDNPPAFYEEVPDPLPDYSVSGYPVSIHFNPAYFNAPKIITFKILLNGQNINNTRLMDNTTDPHKKLTIFDFVLFPLARLEWNGHYQIVIEVQDKQRRQTIKSDFYVRTLPFSVYKMTNNNQTLNVVNGLPVIFYFPPAKKRPYVNNIKWVMPQHGQVQVDMIDQNTMKAHIKGKHCDEIKFTLKNGFQWTVMVLDKKDQDGNTLKCHKLSI